MARKSKRPRKSEPAATPRAARDVNLARWWRSICLGGAAALLVATPLVPTERTELTGNYLPYVMLWLALSLIWFAGAALLKVPLAKLGWIDAIVLALAGWHVVSGLVMMYDGAPRLTINAMWTWISFAVAVILLRQLLRTEREAKGICSVMMALSVCLSMMAIYQAFITYPAQRAYYETNPQRALQEAGIHAPEGSAARKQFESRLYSSEPTATFSLTNSLAGLLAPWLIFAIGIGSVFFLNGHNREPTARADAVRTLIGFALPIALIALCLLLTKSRTAWLATLLGMICIVAILLWQRGLRKQLLYAAGGFAGLALIIVILGFMQMLPERLISAAVLSLKYRFEYWQSTLLMIADYPLFGCGPGNFQNYYTTYKLPQASETIADPHNFVMELAAVAGVPALLIFAALLVLILKGWGVSSSHSSREEPLPDTQEKPSNPIAVPSGVLYAAFGIGVIIAFPLNLVTNNYVDLAPLFLGGVAGGMTLWLMHSWVAHGPLPRWLAPLGMGVLLVNLLAAGGISFPGVMITFWVLIAVMTCGVSQRGWRPSPLASLVFFTPFVLGLLLTCHQTAYRPVLGRERLMAAASLARNRGRYYEHIEIVEEAAEIDPWSALPHLHLARETAEDWVALEDQEDLARCEFHLQRMLDLDAHSSQTEASAGFIYLLLLEVEIGDQVELRKKSIEHFQRAAELYPNDAMTHAQLAFVYYDFGMAAPAKASAARALELDALCPHEERKLANRQIFADFSVARRDDWRLCQTAQHTAEQWMLEIRKDTVELPKADE